MGMAADRPAFGARCSRQRCSSTQHDGVKAIGDIECMCKAVLCSSPLGRRFCVQVGVIGASCFITGFCAKVRVTHMLAETTSYLITDPSALRINKTSSRCGSDGEGSGNHEFVVAKVAPIVFAPFCDGVSISTLRIFCSKFVISPSEASYSAVRIPSMARDHALAEHISLEPLQLPEESLKCRL
eukprot:TRINITY_DN17526_c0_g1_i1.p2 TRINITY_DN17526_c0_g1~~TRINITY_DN17526_c0_g1_i1.p2  ORF type:complete len:184 (+),score=25.35 TRINITY_DN17526_c0_g1_i1:672-1223(+)